MISLTSDEARYIVDLNIVKLVYTQMDELVSEMEQTGQISKQTIIRCKKFLPAGYKNSFSK